MPSRPATEYVSHIIVELGRLGLEVHDIERHDRPPNTKMVLSDLLDWLDDHPGEAFAKLANWQALDFAHMRSRLERNWNAKPRIELSAHITKMKNLSVRWYPRGWRNADYNWAATDRDSFDLIKQRKWNTPPDFHSFAGDEEPTFDSRPANELMYIRGVGNLRPEPCESYGPYATYNRDVVDSLLICAVRAAYERLIKHLEHSFEVDVLMHSTSLHETKLTRMTLCCRGFPFVVSSVGALRMPRSFGIAGNSRQRWSAKSAPVPNWPM
jgi:hypothetical protein